MGISGTSLDLLSKVYLLKDRIELKSVCELGAQELNLNDLHLPAYINFPNSISKKNEIENYEKEYLLKLQVEDIYKKMGIQEYTSIDLNGLNKSLKLDLNEDLLSQNKIKKKYSIVTNFGTSEHCFNQKNFFKNAHDLCDENGFIVGIVPFQKALNHGYFNYQPVFFSDLAKINNYDLDLFWSVSSQSIISRYFVDYTEKFLTQYGNYQKKYRKDNVYGGEEEIGYIFKKKNNSEFIEFSQVYDDENFSLSNEKRKVYSKNYNFDQSDFKLFIQDSSSTFYSKIYKLINLISRGRFKLIFKRVFKKNFSPLKYIKKFIIFTIGFLIEKLFYKKFKLNLLAMFKPNSKIGKYSKIIRDIYFSYWIKHIYVKKYDADKRVFYQKICLNGLEKNLDWPKSENSSLNDIKCIFMFNKIESIVSKNQNKNKILIIQIGSSSGRIIANLSKKYKDIKCIGIDFFKEYTEYSESIYTEKNLSFIHKNAHEVNDIIDKHLDFKIILFSLGSSAYVQPEHLKILFAKISKIKNVNFLLAESFYKDKFNSDNKLTIPKFEDLSVYNGGMHYSHKYKEYSDQNSINTLHNELNSENNAILCHFETVD